MEIKARLSKPYTENQKLNFIVKYSHGLNYKIQETDKELQALDFTDEEKQQQEREYLDSLTISKDELIYALSLKQVKLEDITTIMLPVFHRTDNVIKLIGEKFGYIEADLDFLVKYKVLPH